LFIAEAKIKADIIGTTALFDLNYAVPCGYSWAIYYDAAGI
jgi:hypothetical protein